MKVQSRVWKPGKHLVSWNKLIGDSTGNLVWGRNQLPIASWRDWFLQSYDKKHCMYEYCRYVRAYLQERQRYCQWKSIPTDYKMGFYRDAKAWMPYVPSFQVFWKHIICAMAAVFCLWFFGFALLLVGSWTHLIPIWSIKTCLIWLSEYWICGSGMMMVLCVVYGIVMSVGYVAAERLYVHQLCWCMSVLETRLRDYVRYLPVIYRNEVSFFYLNLLWEFYGDDIGFTLDDALSDPYFGRVMDEAVTHPDCLHLFVNVPYQKDGFRRKGRTHKNGRVLR